MKTTITETMFKDAFARANRTDNFSYAGLSALFEYIEQYEEDCEMSVELDVVALCCEYSEHDSAVDCVNDQGYSVDFPDTCPYCGEGVIEEDGNTCPDCEQNIKEETALEYLRENTQVIEFAGGIIICDF